MDEPNAKAFVLGFEAGEAAEQERIIKLIHFRGTQETREELIELIKEGNSERY